MDFVGLVGAWGTARARPFSSMVRTTEGRWTRGFMASEMESSGVTPTRFSGDPERAIWAMPLRDSVEALLEAELRGLVAPVVLHLRSVWRPVGVVDDERLGAALSLRLLSTSSIVGLGFIPRLLGRSEG
jgi:hypothetical protein